VDPSQLMMAGAGAPFFAAMMGNGYIVPPAGEEGGPPDYDPWRPAAEIVVDPDQPGGGIIFRPRELAAGRMKSAMANRTGRNKTVADRSLAAAEAIAEVAATLPGDCRQLTPRQPLVFSPVVSDGSKSDAGYAPQPLPGHSLVPAVPPPVKPTLTPTTANEHPAMLIPQLTTPPRPVVTPEQVSARPFSLDQLPTVQAGQVPPQNFPPAVHGSLQKALLGRQPATEQLDSRESLQLQLPPQAPGRCVDFEVQGNPLTVQGWFHYVIRDKNTLVLVFDDRVQGFPKQILPVIDEAILMHLRGQTVMYKLSATGIRFTFEPGAGLRYDMQVLLILDEYEAPKPGG
jgi:hypothetical protein